MIMMMIMMIIITIIIMLQQREHVKQPKEKKIKAQFGKAELMSKSYASSGFQQ